MPFESDFYSNSEILPRLTPFKIHEILVVSSLYNVTSKLKLCSFEGLLKIPTVPRRSDWAGKGLHGHFQTVTG